MIEAPIISVNYDENTAKIKINKIDVGVSGFIVHQLSKKHSTIILSASVKSFNPKTGEATLTLTPFHLLDNDSVPYEKYKVKVGDRAQLAFGYTRSLLIAPDEEIYHRITKSIKTQWIHPDLFATILSFKGHRTPLKSDFNLMADATSTGLLFIYLDKKIYTLDMKSFKILTISDAPLEQKSVHLPFYTRVQKIDSSWWDFGAGTSKMKNYEKYYYGLLLKNNKKNKELLSLADNFEKGK
jgi:hypothetical protein